MGQENAQHCQGDDPRGKESCQGHKELAFGRMEAIEPLYKGGVPVSSRIRIVSGSAPWGRGPNYRLRLEFARDHDDDAVGVVEDVVEGFHEVEADQDVVA